MSIKYTPVIGLEVHIQLKTKSKMFSSAKNEAGGAERPNQNIDEIITAQPGTLPVVNREAVRLAALMGLALNCRIDEWSKFDRKHYFYPDLPKGYQISQYDQPIAKEGWMDIEISNDKLQISNEDLENQDSKKITKRVLIQRAHLEEDAGKNMHPAGQPYSLVDYNRAGTPLLEIVTHPCIESAEEARKYLEELQKIARYVGASDADMEKGSMRCEPSISVRLPGETGLPPYKVEVKNINSFKFVEQAIRYEIDRQTTIRKNGETPKQVTMGWNEKLNQTVEQRSKEEAHDYRYMPEPDIPPLYFSGEYLAVLHAQMPELPAAKRKRFAEEYSLPASDIGNLLAWKELNYFFEEAVSELDAWLAATRDKINARGQLVKQLANWCLGDLAALLKNAALSSPKDSRLTPENLAEMVVLIAEGKISGAAGKKILAAMFAEGGEPEDWARQLGLEQVSDDTAITDAIREVIEHNPKAVADFRAGQEKSFGFLVGQTMKLLKGQGNPQIIHEVLRKELSK